MDSATTTAPAPASYPVFAAVALGITGRSVYEVIDLVGGMFEGAGAVFEGSPNAPGTLLALLPPSEHAAMQAVELGLLAQQTAPALRLGVDATEVHSKKEQDVRWQQVIDSALTLQKAARSGEVIAGDGVDTLAHGGAVTQTLHVGEDRYLLLTGTRDLAVAETPPDPEPVAVIEEVATVAAEPGVDEPIAIAEAATLPEPAPEPVVEPLPEAGPVVAAGTPGTRMWDGPFVGRDAELADLRDRLSRASADRRSACVVVSGDAGSGRTRLVRELAASATETRVLTVACRPADDGGARWPLAGLVEALIDVGPRDQEHDVRTRLAARCEGQRDADRLVAHLMSILALDGVTDADEMRWVMRRLFEVGVSEPTLLALEDADRAGIGFVPLLVDAAADATDTPLLIVITTTRAQVGVPGLRLGPLAAHDATALIDAVLGSAEPGLAAAVAARVHADPLAIEQAVAMLAEIGMLAPGEHRWRPLVDLRHVPMPDTATGLIRQRLQTLPPNALTVLGVAAVAGETFSMSPLLPVLPEDVRSGVATYLDDLVTRGYLRQEKAGDTYAFRHPAIREAAIDGVPELTRAAAHRLVGRSLEQLAGERLWRAADPVAAQLAASVERSPEAPAEDRDDALDLLTWSATAAVDEADLDGAARLERRAASLLDDDPARRAELLYLAAEHGVSAAPDRPADREIAEAALAASVAGDDVDWRIRLLRARVRAATGDEDAIEAARATADEAIAALGDDETATWALSSAWALRGRVHEARALNGLVAEELLRAADHAAAAGRTGDETTALRGATRALLDGPTSIAEAEARCTSFVPRVRGPLAEHDLRGAIAVLQARRGAFDEARTAITESVARLDELGSVPDLAMALARAAEIEMLAGEPGGAEPYLQRAMTMTARAADETQRASIAGALAHVLIDLDRLDDAWAAAELAEAHERDLASRVCWRMARARILARRGRAAPAERLVRDGLSLAERTDANDLRATALVQAADVRRHAGRPTEAEPFERRALRLFERRGATAQAGAIAARLIPPDPWKTAPSPAERDVATDHAPDAPDAPEAPEAPEATAPPPPDSLPADALPAEVETNGAVAAGNGFVQAPADPADLSARAEEESRRRWFTR